MRYVYNPIIPTGAMIPFRKDNLINLINTVHERVDFYNDDVKNIIKFMNIEKRRREMFGISATYVNIAKQILIVDQFAIINPTIKDVSMNNKQVEEYDYVKDDFVYVNRPEWVYIEYFDENGNKENSNLTTIHSYIFMNLYDKMVII